MSLYCVISLILHILYLYYIFSIFVLFTHMLSVRMIAGFTEKLKEFIIHIIFIHIPHVILFDNSF